MFRTHLQVHRPLFVNRRLACRILSCPPLRPPLLCPEPQWAQRHFTASSRPQVQYTRFSNGHSYRTPHPNRDRVVKIAVFSGALVVVYVVAHLEQVPETGRWRFMDISPRFEARLGKASYEELVAEFQGKILPPHHPLTHHVRRVVSDLLEASDLGTIRSSPRKSPSDDGLWPDDPFSAPQTRDRDGPADGDSKEWNLLVIDDPKVVNALASFGTIAVFTGILPVCKDEAGLAAVIGHEIGHEVARHGAERYSFSKILLVFATILEVVGVDWGVARLLNYFLFKLPHSRMQELEADTLGIRIAARACYDPRSAVEMHERLARASEDGAFGSHLEFLRTHPLPAHRIKHLEELVPQAYEIRAASSRCSGVRESIDRFLGGISRWG